MLLADEYDAAQERGEVAHHGGGRNFKVTKGNVELPSEAALGLSRKDIHEARAILDADATCLSSDAPPLAPVPRRFVVADMGQTERFEIDIEAVADLSACVVV